MSSAPAPAHAGLAPSAWVTRFSALARPAGTVLDLACGQGRHARWFAQRGHRVCAVDSDTLALAGLPAGVEAIQADLEASPWPLPGRQFDVVVVTNYLWRALLPRIVESVAEGGWLIYETFAVEQAGIGRPSNPDFLLRPGELLDAARPALRVVAYEDGFLSAPDRFVQRVAAVRESAENARASACNRALALSGTGPGKDGG